MATFRALACAPAGCTRLGADGLPGRARRCDNRATTDRSQRLTEGRVLYRGSSMTRSRRRKLMRAASRPAARSTSLRTRLPLASAVLAAIPAAFAQQAQPQSTGAETTGGLEEIVVTAQKRTENLQDVPISIQTLGSQQLEELHISDIDDY